MCGSGRLLIPLLKRGLKIDGVDHSSHMLQSCQERCLAQGLDVQLYNQSLQELSLRRKYDIIFIAIGSFQLIQDLQEALNILKNLSLALLPGGRVVIETFIPWDAIKENIQGSTLSDQSKEMTFERTVHFSEDVKIIHRSNVMVYFKEQLEKTQSRYEKWIQGIFNHAEEEEYAVRWYHRFEMEFFLQKAGFSSVNIIFKVKGFA
jgi:SAM-dependent methyltransferase